MQKVSTNRHPNSRIVTIYQKNSFIMDAQAKEAPDFVAMAKKSLGSYWETSHSAVVGSGLNFAEQKLLMPAIVDCEVTDRQFREKVTDYFANIKTTIPYEKGRELEIGLLIDNDKPLSEENQPLHINDYILYRHALNHPLVASSRELGEGDMLKQFYIFDATASEKTKVTLNVLKDKALELYLTIKKTPEKIDMLLTVLEVDPRIFKGTNAESLKNDRLKSIAEETPEKFIAAYEDKFFEHLYVIKTMVNTGVLRQIGTSVIDTDSGVTLGHDLTETVAWFKDKANSEKLVILKAKMQEGLSKPIAATAKASGSKTK